MLVPGLMLILGFSQPEAQGTSLAAMIPPIGFFAAVVYYQHGFVRIPVAASVAVGFMLGAYLGARLLPHVPVNWLRLGFGGLLLYVGLLFVFGQTGAKHAAALPAGIAATLTALGSWLRLSSRHRSTATLPRPSDHTDYHI
jgi:uncharacterized protein